jgi:hypothetical protein
MMDRRGLLKLLGALAISPTRPVKMAASGVPYVGPIDLDACEALRLARPGLKQDSVSRCLKTIYGPAATP